MSAIINSSSAIRTFAIKGFPKLEVDRTKRPPTFGGKLRNLPIRPRNLPMRPWVTRADNPPDPDKPTPRPCFRDQVLCIPRLGSFRAFRRYRARLTTPAHDSCSVKKGG